MPKDTHHPTSPARSLPVSQASQPPTTARSPSSTRNLPPLVSTALADPFAFGEHPDLPWRLPETLPPVPDLRAAEAILVDLLRPVDRPFATECLARLLVGFNERKTAQETELLRVVWLDANGDIPKDLWATGTLHLLRFHEFGMPKPPHLRKTAEAAIREREAKLNRVKAMLAAAGKVHEIKAIPQSVAERLTTVRDSWVRVGRPDRAMGAERDLAKLEKRAVQQLVPDDWVRPAPAVLRSDDYRPLPSLDEEIAMLPSRIAFWRKAGAPGMVRRLEAELAQHLPPERAEALEADNGS